MPFHTWDLALIEYSRMLKEKSEGAIELTVYSGAQLGSEKEAIEGLQMGTIDFAICSPASLSSFTDSNSVWDMPYLFSNVEEARKALKSETAQKLLEELSKVGIKGLSYWENGIYAVASKKPIRSLADMKNLRIRTIDSKIQAEVYAAFGANPVVLAWGDIYTSLQQGVIDAISSTTTIFMHNSKFEEAAPYIVRTNHGYSPAPIIMSQSLWNSLPEEIRVIVQDVASEAQLVEFRIMDDARYISEKEMKASGATFTDIDINEFRETVKPIYEKYVKPGGINPELVKALQGAAVK
jgi:tripartite ATP-independent transporter DctP family solute receptor